MLTMNKLAMIQYVGIPGITQDCLQAIVRFIHFGDKITEAKILSSANNHCFLLLVNDEYVAIKSGFSSGYTGEGPRGLIEAIKILEDYNNIQVLECKVEPKIIKRIDQSSLLMSDIDSIEKCKSVSIHSVRSNLDEWLFEINFPKEVFTKDIRQLFPKTIVYSMIDKRIMDLALKYKNDSEKSIETGYKRLEGLIRDRTGLKEHGIKLFNKAFVEKDCKLVWIDDANASNLNIGKALLFKSVFMAYRNPRAHNEMNDSDIDLLREFMLMNQLFILEGESKEKSTIDTSTQPMTDEQKI